ncbi:MAG: glycosyltransferase [Longimicrobiales bacterium]
MSWGFLAVLLAAPWLLILAATPMLLVRRPRIRDRRAPSPGDEPLVSVIVPARDEAENISACLATLLASAYGNREIIVVDDRSIDGTADIARVLEAGSNGALRLIVGEPLPDDWLGKCWACWQGYRAARGELLLFTDADTRHDDELLGHAVGTVLTERADLVSIVPRQLMETFWERLVQPQIFTLLMFRYRDFRHVNRSRNPLRAGANGQFLLFRREAYEAIGGHEAVRRNIIEDIGLAQQVVRHGRTLFVGYAEELMDTRMYRSLRGLIEGWSKNLSRGAQQTARPWLRPAMPWLVGLGILLLWVAPPATALAGLFGAAGPITTRWALIATAASVLFWTASNHRLGSPRLYALIYPIGALIAVSLFLRSALRGDRFRWRGRNYRLPDPSADGSDEPDADRQLQEKP